jgi:hypothetical protein
MRRWLYLQRTLMTVKEDFVTPTTDRRRVLLAYLHLGPGVPEATRGLLRDYIENFAEREGYVLDGVVVRTGDQDARSSVRDLIRRIGDCGAETVLVSGAAETALAALKRLSDVRVLTLADVSARRAARS